ncbi:MAG: TIGR01212 family radical SAM protein [Lentisphaeria bacterium]
MHPYYSYRQFLRERYNAEVYRVPIDLGFGCPHRDAVTLEGGCVFCGEHGSRATQLGNAQSLEVQVERGVEFARQRYGAQEFLAYFQAFTATNAPVKQLREIIHRIQSKGEFRGFIFGTRPDCLAPPLLDFLENLKAEGDVWVELGVQTAHDSTLQLINRGHDVACSERAVSALAEHGINVAAHVILGLPGEGLRHFRETAQWLRELPFSGVKIHNLHVVQNTVLADWWKAQQKNSKTANNSVGNNIPPIQVWDEHKYAEKLMAFLRHIPADWPVMRLVSDTPANVLLAPRWWMSKPEFIDYVRKQMTARDWRQGDFAGVSEARPEAGVPEPDPGKIKCDQGEFFIEDTNVSAEAEPAIATAEALADAVMEAFCESREKIRVLDVGLGLNWGGMALYDRQGKDSEINCLTPYASELASPPVYREWVKHVRRLLKEGRIKTASGGMRLALGDPRVLLRDLEGEQKYSAVLLEGAETEKNPILHTVEFCQLLAELLDASGVLISPSPSNLFRAALCTAGFTVGVTGQDQLKRGGTMAALRPERIMYHLPPGDQKALTEPGDRRPLRDPDLDGGRRQILREYNRSKAFRT